MDIEYKGANCVVISTKKVAVTIDPKLSSVGLKDITAKDAIVAVTQSDFVVPSDGVVIDQPGEYEVRNVTFMGVAAKRLIDHDDSSRATMYRIVLGGITFAIVGHVATPLTEEQLETLGVIDVAIVPVGGSGYTLDAHQATEVIRQLDPKVVIPTHYADPAIKYEVPQMELEPFIKELSAVDHQIMPTWKIKNGVLPDVLTLVELTRTA
jgi:L-ascorbate metabolism protein UlaG (beta-lactamase superfamily)